MNYLHVSKTFTQLPNGQIVFNKGVTFESDDTEKTRLRRLRRSGKISARQQKKLLKNLRREAKAV